MESCAGFDPFLTPAITRGRAAAICGVSVDALQGLVERGLITPQRTPGGQLLFSAGDVRLAAEHFGCRRR